MADAASQPTGGASRGIVLRDFTGGLNNVSDISAIGNNELAQITNLELDASGSLVSRPPVTAFARTPTLGAKVDATNLATNPSFESSASTVVPWENLATNPSFEATNGYTTVRTNLLKDPAPSSAFLNWYATNPGGASTTFTYDASKQAAAYTYTTAATNPGCTVRIGADAGSWMSVTAGSTYSQSLEVMSTVADERNFSIDWYNAAGVMVGTSNLGARGVPLSANQWFTYTLTATAPATAIYAATNVIFGSSGAINRPAGSVLYLRKAIFELAPAVGPYFDGSTAASGDFSYAWTGTANASTSVQRGVAVVGISASASTARVYQSATLVKSAKSAAYLAGAPGTQQFNIMGGLDTTKTYTVTAWVTAPRNMSMFVRGGAAVSLAAGVPTRLTATITGEPFAAVRSDDWVVGDIAYFDNATVTEGTYTGPYFDGSTPAAGDFTYSWTGTANASTSKVTVDRVTGGSPFSCASARSGDWHGTGTKSLRLIPTGSSNDSYFAPGGDTGGMRSGMVAGKTYTIAATGRLSTLQTGALSSRARTITVFTKTGGVYSDYRSPAIPNVAGTELRVSVTVTLPADTTEAFVRLYNGALPGSGDVWWDDLVITEGATDGSYFDGDTPDVPDPLGGSTDYAWTGAAHGSTSTKSVPDLAGQSAMDFLGYYNRADGITFMVIAHAGKTYLFNPLDRSYVVVATFYASGCAQYQNRLYLVCRTQAGGWWGEATAGSGIYSFQSLSAGATPMPKGDQIVTYKDRLWIAGWGNSDERTKVYLSDITNTVGGDVNNWPVLNFFYVGRGDGQWITKLHAGPNDLTVFRNASAFYFRYDADPKLGVLSRYEGNIGCDNKYTLASYQNYVYVLSNGALYQLIGYQFYRRNDPAKLEMRAKTTTQPYTVPAALSVFGSRLIIWFSGSIYAFQLTTNVWSQWESPATDIALFRAIQRPEGYFGPDVAYGITGSGGPSKFGIYRLQDATDATSAEAMTCSVRTKAYDYETPDRFKTLFWWSADVLTAQTGVGTAIPVTLTGDIASYDDMEAYSWDQLAMLGTFDHPLVKTPGVTTSRDIPGSSPARVSLKFVKKMRFRRIYYEVSLDTDGTSATGPVHIFSLVTYVETKQKITRGVT